MISKREHLIIKNSTRMIFFLPTVVFNDNETVYGTTIQPNDWHLRMSIYQWQLVALSLTFYEMFRVIQKAHIRKGNNKNISVLCLNHVYAHIREGHLFKVWHPLQRVRMMCIMYRYAKLNSLNFEIRLPDWKTNVKQSL